MMLVRSIRRSDLPAMVALVQSAGVGLTSLPSNIDRLTRRIDASEASIAGETEPADAEYLFVLEDEAAGRVVGLCNCRQAGRPARAVVSLPPGLSVYASRDIDVYRQLQTLFLTNDLTGSSELCSLFLHGDYRHSNNGSLLSKSRMLFLAGIPLERFAAGVIARNARRIRCQWSFAVLGGAGASFQDGLFPGRLSSGWATNLSSPS